MVRNKRPKELLFHGLVHSSARRCNSIALPFVFIVQVAQVMLSTARPNPSIERTVSSGLRPLPTAAHVKR
jgi:hypothetical protein